MNKELFSGFHLVDTFSNCFSFNIVKYKDTEAELLISTILRISIRDLAQNQTLYSLYPILISITILLSL